MFLNVYKCLKQHECRLYSQHCYKVHYNRSRTTWWTDGHFKLTLLSIKGTTDPKIKILSSLRRISLSNISSQPLVIWSSIDITYSIYSSTRNMWQHLCSVCLAGVGLCISQIAADSPETLRLSGKNFSVHILPRSKAIKNF